MKQVSCVVPGMGSGGEREEEIGGTQWRGVRAKSSDEIALVGR